MQNDSKPAQNEFTPRQADRRQTSKPDIRNFPLRLPDGSVVDCERRQLVDRRANAFIARQSLFRGVPWSFIEPCVSACPIRQLDKGEVLLSPEELNEHLYLVRNGRLMVHLDSPESEGKYPIEEGNFAGDISIIDGNPPSAYVVAEVPSQVLAIHKDIFWERVAANPVISRNMLAMFVDRMRIGNRDALESLERELRYEHLQKELQAAHDIQMSLLPRAPFFKDVEQIKAFAMMEAARDVGGDFFDVLTMDDGRVFVAIGDVSGKGMPAALFMTRTMTLLRDCIYRGCDLSTLARNVNNSLCENNNTNMFTTAFVAILDVESGELGYISGGHNPALIGSRADGFSYLPQPKGMLLGVMENAPFEVKQYTMKPGETLVLYTDGVTEAEDINKNFFGDNRLRDLVMTLPIEEPEHLIHGVRNTVAYHAGEAPQSDDITLLALHYRG
jgi:sigma-B regulation protein RsbU (phosphoserine phosphatase)